MNQAQIALVIAQARARRVAEERVMYALVAEDYRQSGDVATPGKFVDHVRVQTEAGVPLGQPQRDKLIEIVERQTGRPIAELLRTLQA